MKRTFTSCSLSKKKFSLLLETLAKSAFEAQKREFCSKWNFATASLIIFFHVVAEAIAGSAHQHFQESHLKYSEKQMPQNSPEQFEEYGLARIPHTLCWKIEQPVVLKFQAAIAGNAHQHFQESHLEYSEKQMPQNSPEQLEEYGLETKKNQILYLAQSKEVHQAIKLYQNLAKEKEGHDFSLLRDLGRIILLQGAKSFDDECQLISMYGVGIAGLRQVTEFYRFAFSSKNPTLQLAAIQFLSRNLDDQAEETLLMAFFFSLSSCSS